MKKTYAALWLIFLLALSLAPLELKGALGTIGRFHSLGHVIVFALTAIIFALTFGAGGFGLHYLPLLLAPFAFEELEVLVYHPSFEWNDIVSDLIGIIAGLGLLAAVRLFRRQQKQD